MKCYRNISVVALKLLAPLAFSLSLGLANAAGSMTATITAAPACSGATPNIGAISIAGSRAKQLGEALDVKYCLASINKAREFDVYVAVQLPDNTLLFLQSDDSFFGTPMFLPKVAAYLNNTHLDGTVLSLSVLPMGLPTGTYTFYAVPVDKGADVMNGFNWAGNSAQAKVTLTR